MAPLNPQSAMQYFETSPWYRIDPPSNNQILRMQNTGMDITQMDEAEQLRGLVGIEFAVAINQGPDLFVIFKQQRSSPDQVQPLEAYYIINNRIQQSPNLYTLLSTRLNSSVQHLMSSMSALRTNRPSFAPTKGYAWPIHFDPTTAFSKDGSSSSASRRGTARGSVAGSVAGDGASARGDSLRPEREGSQVQALGNSDPTQVTISMPLLRAIQTTAAHVLRDRAPPASTNPNEPKRVIKSALELGHPVIPEEPVGVGLAFGLGDVGVKTTRSASLADVSVPILAPNPTPGGKRVVSAASQAGSPFPGTETGTPIRKKKKKAKDIGTPTSALSPVIPGPSFA